MPTRPSPAGQSSLLRQGRVSQPWDCYVITKVVQHRRPLLSDAGNATVIIDGLQHLRTSDQAKLFAFCVMPDHFHVAVCLMPGASLSDMIDALSKFTARRINKMMGQNGVFWQEGFHDRHCRTRDELNSLCEYIEHNPVRAGLVESKADWKFSSASPLGKGMLDREWWPESGSGDPSHNQVVSQLRSSSLAILGAPGVLAVPL
jgi:putative transposase